MWSWTAAVVALDHFKRVNDTWGHAAGDAALVEQADAAACASKQGGRDRVTLAP